MTVLFPKVFWLFLPLLLLLLPAFINFRIGRNLLIRLGGEWRQERIFHVYFVKTIFYWLTMLLFFSFSLLARAGLSWNQEPVKDESLGLDIVFALDISRSMLAQDLHPDRLTRAGELISSVTGNLSGGKNGIVIFKGDGYTMVPLTEDKIIMSSAVSSLSPSLYTVPGSDIAKGLRKAMEAFPQGSPARKVILLITDGESLEGNPVAMARECTLNDIALFVAGAGTVQGSLLYDASGEIISDSSGQAVVSRLNQNLLQEMADTASGRYYDLSDVKTPGNIIQDLSSLNENSGAEGIRFQNQLNFRFFLIIALFFLILNLSGSQLR
uniref:VWA domain-containing protein n=1 Tax=Oceanispirochaeta sp. TaxID=2035350 RepID=UPI0026187695